jgi:beta-phosphoglucomutase-like phosphatase (HAD superfamily)
MRPWPDAEALRSASVPYAFVTNCSSRLAGLAADRSGLDPAFTLSAEEAGYYKPRPEIYHLACTRIGVHPGETRFVAGAAYDADGAHAAGLKARLITRRPGTRLPSGPIEAVESMTAALDERRNGGRGEPRNDRLPPAREGGICRRIDPCDAENQSTQHRRPEPGGCA